MKSTNLSWLNLACTVLVSLEASASLPAHAAQVFNVKSYGAVGNGTTDDTKAISAAVNAANAVPGSILLFPTGNYPIAGVITVSGVEVMGQNATLTSLSLGGLEVSGKDTKVHDLNFATPLSASSGAVGLLVHFANGFEVRNNTFSSNFNQGLNITQSSNGRVHANQIGLSGASTAGVYVGSSSNVTAQNNVVTGQGGSTARAFWSSNSDKVTVDSNQATNLAFGIFSQQNKNDSYTKNTLSQLANNAIDLNTDTQVTVTGNRITQATNAAFRLYGVSTAKIRNNVVTSGQTGVNFTTGNSNINFSGNDISAVTNAVTGGYVNNLAITGNTFDSLTTGINQISDANLEISYNVITQCTNAAIVVKNCIGTTQLQDNVMRNCGLAPTDPKAIIYLNCPLARSIVIDSNKYTGAANATYYIWCVQPSPPARVTGNPTNTSLPNRIGS